MRTFVKMALSCLCFSFLLFSCTDDSNEPSEGAKLTPEQNKEKLETIGLKAISKINAADHQDLLKTVDVFARLADDGELEIVEKAAALSIMKNVRTICAKANLGKMMSFAAPESDLYSAAQYYGIYSYNEAKKEWDYQNSDSKLEFHFPANGSNAVLTVGCSGKETEIVIDDETNVMVPEKAESTLTLGEKELFKLVVNNSIDNATHKADLTAELSASGYLFSAAVKAEMELASCDFLMKKGSERLISATSRVTGKAMTDHPEDVENPEDLFKTAEVEVYLMDDMNIRVSCSDIKAMVKLIDSLTGDGASRDYNDKVAQSINKYSKAEMRYSGSDNVIATVEAQSYLEDSYSNHEYWDVEPILVFAVDNSRCSFESYFDEIAFNDLINNTKDLGKLYESYLKYLMD